MRTSPSISLCIDKARGESFSFHSIKLRLPSQTHFLPLVVLPLLVSLTAAFAPFFAAAAAGCLVSFLAGAAVLAFVAVDAFTAGALSFSSACFLAAFFRVARPVVAG